MEQNMATGVQPTDDARTSKRSIERPRKRQGERWTGYVHDENGPQATRGYASDAPDADAVDLQGFWKIFWKGGGVDEGEMDKRSPDLMSLPEQPDSIFQASIWGMSFPWTLIVAMLLGIWLVFSPYVFDVRIQTSSASLNHLCGALVVVVSVSSMGEVLRIGRYLNVPLGLAVSCGIWFTGNAPTGLSISCLVVGLIIGSGGYPADD